MHMHSRNSTCPAGATSDMVKDQEKEDERGLTAGFHQLSIRYTRDASVKLSATPPAFRLTRNMVTSTLFTLRKKNSDYNAIIGPCTGLTEMLNSGIPCLRAHRTLEPADLRGAVSRCSN
jgi:hypothetical protein